MHRRDLIIAGLATVPLTASRGLAGAKPVVLELFTSQGCSSCPPADAFLGELTRQTGVIGLAWHVDYWNNLGWRDPYARPEWTERQKIYAKQLSNDVFTPALVVNGAAMVVGSDKEAVRQAIDAASPPPVTVALRRSASGLEADIGALSDNMTGILATYDPEHATQVAAGENQGRRLVEYRVVRDVLPLNTLSRRMALQSVPEHRGAVLLVRDTAWRVVGAADLPPGAAAS